MPAQPTVATSVAELQRGERDLNGLKRDLVQCAFCGRAGGWIRRGFLRRRGRTPEAAAG